MGRPKKVRNIGQQQFLLEPLAHRKTIEAGTLYSYFVMLIMIIDRRVHSRLQPPHTSHTSIREYERLPPTHLQEPVKRRRDYDLHERRREAYRPLIKQHPLCPFRLSPHHHLQHTRRRRANPFPRLLRYLRRCHQVRRLGRPSTAA